MRNFRDIACTYVAISQKVVDGFVREDIFVQEVILHIIGTFEPNRRGPPNLHANLHGIYIYGDISTRSAESISLSQIEGSAECMHARRDILNVHMWRYLKKLWTALLENDIFVIRRSFYIL